MSRAAGVRSRRNMANSAEGGAGGATFEGTHGAAGASMPPYLKAFAHAIHEAAITTGRRTIRVATAHDDAFGGEGVPLAERRVRAAEGDQRTIVVPCDPKSLTLDQADASRTLVPSFDPCAFARAIDAPLRTTGEPRSASPYVGVEDVDDGPWRQEEAIEGLGRRMYQRYLESEFPAALELAESVLVRKPDHPIAHLVAERCRAVLGGRSDAVVLSGSSIIRASRRIGELRSLPMDPTSAFVLWHIDGVSSLDVIAEVSGIPPAATIGCFQALLELGVVEVVAEPPRATT